MGARWMLAGLALVVSGVLCGADSAAAAPAASTAPTTSTTSTTSATTPTAPPPARSAPLAAEPLPSIYFTPAAVSFSQTFVTPKSGSEAPTNVIMINDTQEQNELRLRLLATTDEHWLILQIENPVLIDAQTAIGETLSEENITDFRSSSIFFDGSLVRQSGGVPQYLNLSLNTPHQPATSLKSVVATVDLILAKDDSIKSTTVKIGNEESEPLPIDDCDMTFQKVEGRVEIKYSLRSFGMIKSLTFIDSNGQPCTGHMRFQRSDDKKFVSTLQFPNRNVTSAVVEYYGTTRSVQATVRLKNVPLLGLASQRQLEPHRADAVHEIPRKAALRTPPVGLPGGGIIVTTGIVPAGAPAAPAAPAPIASAPAHPASPGAVTGAAPATPATLAAPTPVPPPVPAP